MASDSFQAGVGAGVSFAVIPGFTAGVGAGAQFLPTVLNDNWSAGVQVGSPFDFESDSGYLATRRYRRPADSFAETPEGILLIANGIDPMLRWNGLTKQCEPAGIIPPASAVTMSGGGSGQIVGAYFAYVRFVDESENVSDLSPISAEFDATGNNGTVTNVSNTTPPVVTTSAAHGLYNGALVVIEGVGPDAYNNTWAITVIGTNSFSLNDGQANGAYTGGGTWKAGVATITYSNVPFPGEQRVVRRQILRNTDGQAQTFYVDIDTNDLGSSSFISTKADTDLVNGIAVPLLDTTNNRPIANSNGIPPNWKATLAHHLGRMFAGGEVEYTEGSVSANFGLLTVQGIGTEWPTSFIGRAIYVQGARKSHTITAVDVGNQRLTIDTPFSGATTPYAGYAIRPQPAERRVIYYSEAGLPESWPIINGISLQEDGDEITGLVANSSFLFILERLHIYRFTFQGDPATDGFVFQSSASRGCVNNRCWVSVEESLYMLDQQGIHRFDGGSSEPLSMPIQDLFRRADGNYEINWSASNQFHAVHYPTQETIRWFVCLSGHYLPQHALAFNYRLKRWWIEYYANPVGCSAKVELRGEPLSFLGADSRRILALWTNTLDGPDPSAGTVRGTATAAGLLSLADSGATFDADALAGCPLSIVDGTGKGQTRIVSEATATQLMVTLPWLTMPDTTSVYQLGGVEWRWRSSFYRWADDESDNTRRIEMQFDPTPTPSEYTLRVYYDTTMPEPEVWKKGFGSDETDGVRSADGSPDLVCDSTKRIGFIQKMLGSHKDRFADGTRYVFMEVSGFTTRDEQLFFQFVIDGAVTGQ